MTPPTAPGSLHLTALSKRYGPVTAVDNVTLDIQRLVAKAQAEYEAQVAAEEAAQDSEAAE